MNDTDDLRKLEQYLDIVAEQLNSPGAVISIGSNNITKTSVGDIDQTTHVTKNELIKSLEDLQVGIREHGENLPIEKKQEALEDLEKLPKLIDRDEPPRATILETISSVAKLVKSVVPLVPIASKTLELATKIFMR